MALTKTTNRMTTGESLNVLDFGAVGDGVTDDTAAIKACLLVAQNQSDVSSWPHSSIAVTVKFGSGNVFKVTGDNPLGYNTANTKIVSYHIDLSGSTVRWTPSATDQALVDYGSKIFNFNLVNGTIELDNGAAAVPQSILIRSASEAHPVVSYFSYHNYEGLNVKRVSGSTVFKNIFKLDGWSHCDQSRVLESNFSGFENFYYSSNAEAVDWLFQASGMFPDVENYKIWHHDGQWSGGMRIIGCEIGSRTGGYAFYSDGAVTSSSNGYVYCNSRFEHGTASDVTIMDVKHGRYDIVGANFYAAGGSSGTFKMASLRGSAEISLKQCVIPALIEFEAQTPAEWDITHANGLVGTQLTIDDCIIAGGGEIPVFVDTSDVVKTFREVVSSTLVTPRYEIRNCVSTRANGIKGIPKNSVTKATNKVELVFGSAAGNAYMKWNTTTLGIPGYCVITSIKARFSSLPSNFNYLAVEISGVKLITKPIPYSVGSDSIELIPAGSQGISIPLPASSSLNIYIDVLDSALASTGTTVAGEVEMEYTALMFAKQLPATDVATLLTAKNEKVQTLQNVATPPVAAGRHFVSAGGTTITDFLYGEDYQEITILNDGVLTITHNASKIKLNGSVNFAMTAGDTLSLVHRADGIWYETSRMVL